MGGDDDHADDDHADDEGTMITMMTNREDGP